MRSSKGARRVITEGLSTARRRRWLCGRYWFSAGSGSGGDYWLGRGAGVKSMFQKPVGEGGGSWM